jgi:hypothetical protein
VSDYQQYREINFDKSTREFIDIIDKILTRYSRKGMSMTVRQIHYRLVGEIQMPNTKKSYKRLVKVVTDARLAGLLDWDAVEDRHRAWQRRQSFDSGKQFIDAVANSYHKDLWLGQEYRPFVLIEKDTLSGVFSSVCYDSTCRCSPARATSVVVIVARLRTTDLRYTIADGQQPIVFHFGDHDPSGIDMTRDLIERLAVP